MHDSLLAAHEFRLRLKCIYDVQPCSPCPQAPKAGGIAENVRKKSILGRRGRTHI
jgi:hypothetical protein